MHRSGSDMHPNDEANGTSRIDPDNIPPEMIERVVNTRGFQKMLAYTRLAHGLDALKDNDALYDSLVNSIEERHSRGLSDESIEEVLDLFVDEVETYTEGLVDDEDVDDPQELVDTFTVED